MILREYRPGFVDISRPLDMVEVSSAEQLLEVRFVKSCRFRGFIGYSFSDRHLMAHYEDGKKWVVGIFQDRVVDTRPLEKELAEIGRLFNPTPDTPNGSE